MSLILDALRKSEAERRRGEIPDLRAELPPTPRQAAPRRRWPFWFAGIASVIAILALAWGLWVRTPDTPPSEATVATPDQTPAPAPASESITLPTEPADSLPPPAPPIRSRPIAGAEPEPVQPVADDVYAAASARQPPPRDEPKPYAPQAAPESSAPATPDERYAPAITNAASTPAPVVPVPSSAAVPAPAVAPASVAPTPIPPAASGPSVRISDLSPGEREQLPALKISMHMFGPTPAQRFAIIDGARVGQGDRIGEAVVEEIAPDSVVLNWHGRRVALPLR